MRTTLMMLIALGAPGCELIAENLPVEDPENQPDTAVVDDGERTVIDIMLPMTNTALAAGYLYCINDDRLAMEDLLLQQLDYADVPTEDHVATAREILQNGLCNQLTADLEADYPMLRVGLREFLVAEGLDPRRPITDQTADDEPETHASIFKKIWDWIKDLFDGPDGPGGDDNSKHVTNDLSGATIEGDVVINICVPTDTSNPSDPEPFYPDPPPQGG